MIEDELVFAKKKFTKNNKFLYISKESSKFCCDIAIETYGTDSLTENLYLYSIGFVKTVLSSGKVMLRRLVFFHKNISQNFFESFWTIFLHSDMCLDDFMRSYKFL